jgi:hypothetical protein
MDQSLAILSADRPTWMLVGSIVSVIVVIICIGVAMYYSRKEKKIPHNTKNRALLRELILGDKYSSSVQKNNALEVYPKWISVLEEVDKNANVNNKIRLKSLIIKRRINEYVPGVVVYELPPEIEKQDVDVMKDCFTNIFPSRYDMDDWALRTKLTQLFVLKGIDKNFANGSIVHIKKHFVNHKMVLAVIQFDLYIPKTKVFCLGEFIKKLRDARMRKEYVV